jgi:hypothetical protein
MERGQWGVWGKTRGSSSASGSRGEKEGIERLEEEDDPDRGSYLSAVWKKKEKRKEREGVRGASWASLSRASPVGCLFFFVMNFSILFSVLLFIFSFWLQIDSNNLVKFSKIQSIKVGQSETSFQNKIRFSIKPYEF